MNLSSYRISISELKRLFKKLGLLKAQYDKKCSFSSAFIEQSRKGNYIDIYKTAIQNLDYDILLFDDSIFQFSFINSTDNGKVIRYAYYQFPFDILPYDEYLRENGFSYEEVGDYFLEEYGQQVAEARLNNSALAIRYDFSIEEYASGIHPASHFHVGLNNHFRLPIAYYLTPTMFGVFIIKQIYYEQWKQFLSNTSFRHKFEKFKKQCMQLEHLYFNALDKKELYLY